jgi:NAD(P)-dependent dehydrogenase (short-subunit alcohol dehydrogenase family)
LPEDKTSTGIKMMSKVWFVTGAGSGIGAGIVKAALKSQSGNISRRGKAF